jgi:hypothetical protein
VLIESSKLTFCCCFGKSKSCLNKKTLEQSLKPGFSKTHFCLLAQCSQNFLWSFFWQECSFMEGIVTFKRA